MYRIVDDADFNSQILPKVVFVHKKNHNFYIQSDGFLDFAFYGYLELRIKRYYIVLSLSNSCTAAVFKDEKSRTRFIWNLPF